jgi:exodeoxyribonuclease VII small subunit
MSTAPAAAIPGARPRRQREAALTLLEPPVYLSCSPGLPHRDKHVTKKTKAPDFEAAMAELEAIVERLEHGDLPLEESLKQFERGVELTRSCQAALKQAEQKVKLLTTRPGAEAALADFEPEDRD